MQHSDDSRSFVVGNLVEYRIDLGRVANLHFDRVTVLEAVELLREDVAVGAKPGQALSAE